MEYKVLLKIIINKTILTIIFITILLLVYLSVYLPKVTEQNTVDLIIKNSTNAVQQIKLTRAYYVEEIVRDIEKFAPQIQFDYNHKGVDGKIAFPTSLVHELSDIFTQNTGMQFQLYSKYPFKIKKDRILSSAQKEALEYIEKNDTSIWTKRDVIDGKEVLRVAVADVMTQQACVDCHNYHQDKLWDEGKWKLGDKRGVIEVITPLDESLAANNAMKNKILFVIFIAMLILVIYYSISLIKREQELLDANELLDIKVKEEVAKNLQKEKQLVQQSRSAVMGDMMAAIIHQWKQPLSIISLNNSAISLHQELQQLDDKFLKTKLDEIKKQIGIMSTTMDDFKNFFKPSQAVVYDVNEAIENTLKMVRAIYEKDGIQISVTTNESLPTLGYINELNQVLINILNNARDAIELNNSMIKTITINTYKQYQYGVITITDCAGGIPEEIIDKIFEPYMTTKEQYGGTGIGLDMSKTIIEKVNGSIQVKNVFSTIDGVEYKGAQFIVRIPLTID